MPRSSLFRIRGFLPWAAPAPMLLAIMDLCLSVPCSSISPLGGEAAAPVQWKPPKNSLPPSRRHFWFRCSQQSPSSTAFIFKFLRGLNFPLCQAARFSAAMLHCSLPIAAEKKLRFPAALQKRQSRARRRRKRRFGRAEEKKI